MCTNSNAGWHVDIHDTCLRLDAGISDSELQPEPDSAFRPELLQPRPVFANFYTTDRV